MTLDYITTSTKDDIFHEYCEMPDDLLAIEITVIKCALNDFSKRDSRTIESSTFSYLADTLDILKDALVFRLLQGSTLFNQDDKTYDKAAV